MCSQVVRRWRGTIRRAGFDVFALQSEEGRARIGVDEGAWAGNVVLVMADGRVFRGAAAYVFGMRTVWWLRPLGWVLGLPGMRWVADRVYKYFSNNRFKISKRCGWEPDLPDL